MTIARLIESATKDRQSATEDVAERFRVIAKAWAKSDGRARQLEEMKSAVLARRMKALGDKPIAAAERDVKASQEWADFLTEMVQARVQANTERGEMEYLHMKFHEAHPSARAI